MKSSIKKNADLTQKILRRSQKKSKKQKLERGDTGLSILRNQNINIPCETYTTWIIIQCACSIESQNSVRHKR